MSELPVEIFRLVFGLLSHDKKFLHSCLLVNRTWRESVVSILWRDPFKFLQKPSAQLIQTYISCMDEAGRKNLEGLGINFENEPLCRPTFDYVGFLRHLKYTDFYYSSRAWLEEILGQQKNLDFAGFLVTKELFKFFMNQCQTILSLEINTEHLYPPDDADYVSIPCFPGAPKCLSQLQDFVCCGNYNKKGIFKEMTQSCRNIRTLSVDYFLDEFKTAAPSELARLIKNQHALVEFKLIVCYRFLSKIIPALESQKKTLTNVEFRGIRFENGVTFEALVACTSLESLTFFNCDNVTDQASDPLSTAFFPKLRKIVFNVLHTPPKALAALICNNSVTLQDLSLEWPPLNDSQSDPQIIEKIIEQCPNIIKFEAHLKTSQLLSLLGKCSLLEDLTVRGREPLFADGFLPQLGQMAPPKLRVLNICAIWSFSPESLQQFLDHCTAPLEYIGLRECYAMNDEHLDVLTQYAEKGTLKHLNVKAATRITREGLENALRVISHVDHSLKEEREEPLVNAENENEIVETEESSENDENAKTEAENLQAEESSEVTTRITNEYGAIGQVDQNLKEDGNESLEDAEVERETIKTEKSSENGENKPC
ncbi:14617_t:CDS:1 [Acaulospora colombiana]|uniref:14617_t:CDS:1 n=1 Tax=Acaulospora colombiana TaxID=27376 RepID=A0ACA9MB58_9GLOM|nr:14617_t:CDS:1 [Acaulospora colombiana]